MVEASTSHRVSDGLIGGLHVSDRMRHQHRQRAATALQRLDCQAPAWSALGIHREIEQHTSQVG
ncbi:hypothetical protein ACVWWG_006339 [Bradyrhizobium sp. LB7.2]